MAAVYRVEHLVEKTELSAWSIYEDVRRAERGEQASPIGRLAIRVGRSLIWPKAPVDRLLGIEPVSEATVS